VNRSQRQKRTNRRKLTDLFQIVLLLCVATLFIVVYPHLPYSVFISRDCSLPYRLWLRKTFNIKTSGSFVELIPPVENRYTEGKVLLKKIVCGPGDHLTVRKSSHGGVYDYFCNGRYLCTSLARSLAGEPVKSFVYNGTIPKDKYFVIGTHPRSYDSRYFGFVDKKLILSEVYPLW